MSEWPWLSLKIPGAALWTSSARTAWGRRPRWIFCPSESFLGDQKWRNRRERSGLYGGWPRWTLTHVSASFQSRDLHPWSSSGGQWTSALLSELPFVTHVTIFSTVCTLQTPVRFFFNALIFEKWANFIFRISNNLHIYFWRSLF